MISTLLCVGFLVAHAWVRPLRASDAQALQCGLLVCLVAVSLCSAPFADSGEKAIATVTSRADDFAAALAPVVSIAVPVLLVAASLVHRRLRLWWRRGRRLGRRRAAARLGGSSWPNAGADDADDVDVMTSGRGASCT